jgi:hypothetical protein
MYENANCINLGQAEMLCKATITLSPVAEALDSLAYELGTLEAMLDKLETKLYPALKPLVNPTKAEGPVPVDNPISDLTANLLQKRRQMQRLQEIVSTLTNRIEL